jgi:hypothetical protein
VFPYGRVLWGGNGLLIKASQLFFHCSPRRWKALLISSYLPERGVRVKGSDLPPGGEAAVVIGSRRGGLLQKWECCHRTSIAGWWSSPAEDQRTDPAAEDGAHDAQDEGDHPRPGRPGRMALAMAPAISPRMRKARIPMAVAPFGRSGRRVRPSPRSNQHAYYCATPGRR